MKLICSFSFGKSLFSLFSFKRGMEYCSINGSKGMHDSFSHTQRHFGITVQLKQSENPEQYFVIVLFGLFVISVKILKISLVFWEDTFIIRYK